MSVSSRTRVALRLGAAIAFFGAVWELKQSWAMILYVVSIDHDHLELAVAIAPCILLLGASITLVILSLSGTAQHLLDKGR